MEKVQKRYDWKVKKTDEIKVPIVEIYQYPVRGVRGCAVDKVKLMETGPVFDRIWI